MGQYTIQDLPDVSAVTPIYAAVAASDFFVADQRGPGVEYLIHVKNAGASPDSLVIDDPNTPSPAGATAFNPDATYSITNAQERFIYLRNVDRFVDPATGRVNITHSFITSVTIAIFRLVD